MPVCSPGDVRVQERQKICDGLQGLASPNGPRRAAGDEGILPSRGRDVPVQHLRLAERSREVREQNGVGPQRRRERRAGRSLGPLHNDELETLVAPEEDRERIAVDTRIRQRPVEFDEDRNDLLLARSRNGGRHAVVVVRDADVLQCGEEDALPKLIDDRAGPRHVDGEVWNGGVLGNDRVGEDASESQVCAKVLNGLLELGEAIVELCLRYSLPEEVVASVGHRRPQ